jgi:hypothetical protein
MPMAQKPSLRCRRVQPAKDLSAYPDRRPAAFADKDRHPAPGEVAAYLNHRVFDFPSEFPGSWKED